MWMFRKRTPSGQLEPPARYLKRQTCSNVCRGRKLRRGSFKKGRGCEQCSGPIIRKKYSGGYEPRKWFRRRRFCGAECYRLWLDDPLNRMEHGRRCRAGRLVSIKRNAAQKVCYHGRRRLADCDYCSEIASVTGPSRLMRTHDGWRPLWDAEGDAA